MQSDGALLVSVPARLFFVGEDIAQARQRNRDAIDPPAPLSTEGTSGGVGAGLHRDPEVGAVSWKEIFLSSLSFLIASRFTRMSLYDLLAHGGLPGASSTSARRHASSVSSTGSPMPRASVAGQAAHLAQACGRKGVTE